MTKTEVEQCNRIREWAERLGFEVYPEVDGWDLVLVSAAPVKLRGILVEACAQVGIHAKLRANCDVLMQAVARGPTSRHPHLPFVAVPEAGQGFRFIACRLGIGVIETEGGRRRVPGWGRPPMEADPRIREHPQPHGNPPLKLPPVASRCIAAGSPSPRVLSEWRVNALRFLAFARARETFKVGDLVGFGLGKSWADRWGERVGWDVETRRGKPVRVGIYHLTKVAERLPDFGYADVAAELAAAPDPRP